MSSYTLEDYFNAFLQVNRLKQFSTGVQAVYFSILGEFYKQHFPTNIALSTRDLQALAGLKSVSATHEAKNVLKNNGLVDFQNRFGTTVYSLGLGRIPNAFRTPTEHLPNTCRTLTEQSSTPYHSISCTQNQTQSSTTSIYSSNDDDLLSTKSLKSTNLSSSSVVEINEVKDDDDDSGWVFKKLWEVRTESKLGEQEALELEKLGKLYGYRIFEKVLTKCIRFKGSDLHFNYFLAAITDEAEKKQKGGDKDGRGKQPETDKRIPENLDTEEFPW